MKAASASARPSSPVVQRAFVPGWKKDFPWLDYDSAEKSMRCTLCVSQKHDTIWATGTANFRLKTVRDHAQSNVHLLAVAANDKTQRGVVPGMAATMAKRHSAVMLAMRARPSYWLVVEEVANIKFNNFMAFLRDCGVADALALHRGANASHDSPVIFNELLACLSDVAQKELPADIRSSPFIGLGMDESTDRSMEKHLVVIVRYVARGTCCTAYLQCMKIADGKAVTVVDAVKEVAATYKFNMRKVVGLGTDGASVMASDLNGVNGLLTNDNPHLVFMHCVCHRLNLAVSQACAGITDMVALQSVLAAVYTFIQLSPTRLVRFKEMAAVLEVDTLKFKRIYEIRYNITF